MAKTSLKMSTAPYNPSLAAKIEETKAKAKITAEGKVIDDAKLQAEIDANTAKIQSEDSESNAILAEAMAIGEELASHPEFVDAMRTAIQAKEDDEYKSVACLKWLEKFLPPNKLKRLPYPGSTKAEAEAEWNKLPVTDRPNIIIFDKVVASGGRKGTESYYKTLVRSLPTGKEAYDTKARLEKENAEAVVNKENARPESIRKAEDDRANRAINQQLSALRTAAKVYIQIERIKKLKNIEFQWVRDEYTGDKEIPDSYDSTQLFIPGMGEIVHSPKVIWMKNKDTPAADPYRFSIGQFIRFNISDAMIAKGRSAIGGSDGLIASAKKKSEPRTTAVSKERDVHNAQEVQENFDAVLNYLTSDPSQEQARNLAWKGGYAVDDTTYTRYKLFVQLRSDFEGTSGLEAKAKELVAKKDAK